MGRSAKPWYRAVDGFWYATIVKGTPRQKLLRGKNNKSDERKAIDIFNRMRASTNPRATLDDAECANLVELFLEHAHTNCKPSTYQKYCINLNYFTAFCGRVPCRDLTLQHAERLLKLHAHKKPRQVESTIIVAGKERKHITLTTPWGLNMQATVAQVIRTCFNWGVKSELISRNPFAHLKRSFTDSTRNVVDDDTWKIILANSSKSFADFLTALRETGCRPSEVSSVTANDVHGATWVLREHKTDGTGKARVVYLNKTMQQLTARLVKDHPTGPLFSNSRGKPWSKNAIVQRFDNLRERLGLPDHVIAYATGRHSYITTALTNGVPKSVVAHLVGTSERMIEKHYSHLDSKSVFMLESAEQATKRTPKRGKRTSRQSSERA